MIINGLVSLLLCHIKEDVTKADGVKRASARVQRLMRAYARQQGTQASIATLKEGLKNNDTT